MTEQQADDFFKQFQTGRMRMPDDEPVACHLHFLSDVITAAGLLSHGKQSGPLAKRIAEYAERMRSALYTRPQPAAPDTDVMVNRFLAWKLPADFSPDCGISFKRESDYEHPQFGRTKFEPTGTNLLNGVQAKAMLEHVVGHQPAAWVGLTDEEVDGLDCVHLLWQDYEQVEIHGIKEFARAIEAKLKEKNT